jgi:hypothetical protein
MEARLEKRNTPILEYCQVTISRIRKRMSLPELIPDGFSACPFNIDDFWVVIGLQ